MKSKLVLSEDLEIKSRYGKPHVNSRFWFWKDELQNIGSLRANTEMEALERLREAFPDAGCITWISGKEYNDFI
ncbi:hypothetical protein [Chryseobacterium sp.]|uniref:hypothetical protein n=1 Tax=Chryseobacterium sp. TaxID=1871047 RepID=UPI0028A20025|nr:hypothetical protein [Chryseobacterium sp.]